VVVVAAAGFEGVAVVVVVVAAAVAGLERVTAVLRARGVEVALERKGLDRQRCDAELLVVERVDLAPEAAWPLR